MEENVTNSNIGDTNGSHPLQCTKFPEFQEHLDICQECPDLIFLTVKLGSRSILTFRAEAS